MTDFRVFTTGVYGKSEAQFFGDLSKNGIDILVDIRNRRGMRGSTYAFVNSKRLQAKLEEMSIKYFHAKYLAPTEEIRQAQKNHDKQTGILKRQRKQVSNDFANLYRSIILTEENVEALLSDLKTVAGKKSLEDITICLLCVEREPDACHRSFLATKLKDTLSAEIKHI